MCARPGTRLTKDFFKTTSVWSKQISPKPPSCCLCSATQTAQTSSALSKFCLPQQAKETFSRVYRKSLAMSGLQTLKSIKKVYHIILQAHTNPLPTLLLKILRIKPLHKSHPESLHAAMAGLGAPALAHRRRQGDLDPLHSCIPPEPRDFNLFSTSSHLR